MPDYSTSGMKEVPAFEVRMPDGHVYAIYADGRISGFDGNPVVFNRIPQLMDWARIAGRREEREACAMLVENADSLWDSSESERSYRMNEDIAVTIRARESGV